MIGPKILAVVAAMGAMCSAVPHQLSRNEDSGPTTALSTPTPQPQISRIQIHQRRDGDVEHLVQWEISKPQPDFARIQIRQKREGDIDNQEDSHLPANFVEKLLAFVGLGRTPLKMSSDKQGGTNDGQRLSTWPIAQQDDQDGKPKAWTKTQDASDPKKNARIITWPHPDLESEDEWKSREVAKLVEEVMDFLGELIPSKEALDKYKKQLENQDEQQPEEKGSLAKMDNKKEEKPKIGAIVADKIVAPGPLIPNSDAFPKVAPKKSVEEKPGNQVDQQPKTASHSSAPSKSG